VSSCAHSDILLTRMHGNASSDRLGERRFGRSVGLPMAQSLPDPMAATCGSFTACWIDQLMVCMVRRHVAPGYIGTCAPAERHIPTNGRKGREPKSLIALGDRTMFANSTQERCARRLKSDGQNSNI